MAHEPNHFRFLCESLATESYSRIRYDTAEGRLSKGRLGLVEGTLRRYFLPYFGQRLINTIDQTDFSEYDEWRLNYWTSGAGAGLKVARKAKIPAQKTLAMEQSILRLLFRHAVEQGDLEQLPYMKAKRARTNRRGAFDVGEYRLLIRTLRQDVAKTGHTRVKRDRQRLELYVRLLTQTGVRIGEARKLRWRDVELIGIGSGQATTALRLWVDGKTGKRAVIATLAAKTTIRKLLAFSGYENIDEVRAIGRKIFEHDNGDDLRTFEVGFKALLKRAGLALDRYGNNRTLYSLRHSYATYRLLYGKTDVYLLARNMGTSVAMIENHYGHVRTTLAAERLV